MMKHLILILSFLSLLASFAAAQGEPQGSIAATVDDLLEVLYGTNRPRTLEEKESRLRSVIEKRYSFDLIVQRALGRNRSKISAGEQQEIVRHTTDLIIRTYCKRFSAANRPSVSYGKASNLGQGKVELPSTVTLDGSKYQLFYRCAKIDGGWVIYDIVIEGVSLSANYRKQFDDHFQKGTASQLIDRLKSLLAQST